MNIEEYDYNIEQRRLRSLQREMELKERQGLAMQAALPEHPVTSYVKNLPVESAVYPAIEYLRLENQEGTDDGPHQGSQEGFRNGVQNGSQERCQKGCQERRQDIDPKGSQESEEDILLGIGSPPNVIPSDTDVSSVHKEAVPPINLDDPSISTDIPPYRQYIQWCMPAHDNDRPVRKGCGFIHSKSGGGLVYSACPNDHEHYIKGKRMHCWSLRCPQCMNDTALKRGIAIETRLLEYKHLMEKRGQSVGDIGHWVVSPPQELVKKLCQTKPEFDQLCKRVDDSMAAYGATAGVTIFHPWRQKEEGWRFSPHFHILCYGRINTTEFRKVNPGWMIKKVHPRERIRSIRHTAAYLTTHMGLGMAEKDPDEIDWDLKVLDMLIPGLQSPGATYTEKDHNDRGEGKGRMLGDLSRIDWEQWTMDQLYSDFRIRFWGGASRTNIRTLEVYRQYKIRVCQECGELLRTYDGPRDTIGSYIRYIRDSPIVAFAEDIDLVRTVFQRFKSELREKNLTVVDLSRACRLTVCTLDLGLPENKDLIMDGPFDEPDAYFLRRQKAAFESDESASINDGIVTT